MKDVSIVILNFNGRDFLEKFLPSVIEHSKGYEIIVADNCSTDNSLTYLEQNFPKIRLIKLSKNGGFSKGYNEALKQVESKYYVLLNSDIEVTKNWIEPVISQLELNPIIVAAQPKIKSYHEKEKFEYAGAGGGFIDALGYPFCRGRIFLDLEKDIGQYNNTKEIFWATGACLFIKSESYWDAGGLDEDFFAHMEEIDLCWKLNNKGFKILYCGDSEVYHVGGGTLPKTNPRKTYLNFRNGLSILIKNVNFSKLLWMLPIRIILDWVAAFKFLLFDSWKDGIAVFKAHFYIIRTLPLQIRKRKNTHRSKFSKEHIYPGSIVIDHFLKGKKRFGELGWKKEDH